MTLASNPALPIDFVRYQFPALDSYWAFLDNAGGTQLLQQVIDRIQDYWLTTQVQLGAPYEPSQRGGDRISAAKAAIATFAHTSPNQLILGQSTSLLLRILAWSLGQTWQAGDEVVVTNCDHEANISPWLSLKTQGIEVKTWPLNLETLALDLADLEPLLTPRTRLVAFTHVSNILGTLHPVAEMTRWIHDRGIQMCVDGVGYAPHRLLDLQGWDVDFYVFSCYKTFGPQQSILYGKAEVLEQLPGFNHSFITTVPEKFQAGGIDYALTYGLLGMCDYWEELGKQVGDASKDLRECMDQSFALIAQHEAKLADRLLSFLREQPSVRILGQTTADPHCRVPTLSFVVKNQDSSYFPQQLAEHHLGLRSGHFYAPRLIDTLGLTPQNGVVRVSLVHYNTLEEVDRLIEHLEPILSV